MGGRKITRIFTYTCILENVPEKITNINNGGIKLINSELMENWNKLDDSKFFNTKNFQLSFDQVALTMGLKLDHLKKFLNFEELLIKGKEWKISLGIHFNIRPLFNYKGCKFLDGEDKRCKNCLEIGHGQGTCARLKRCGFCFTQDQVAFWNELGKKVPNLKGENVMQIVKEKIFSPVSEYDLSILVVMWLATATLKTDSHCIKDCVRVKCKTCEEYHHYSVCKNFKGIVPQEAKKGKKKGKPPINEHAQNKKKEQKGAMIVD